MVGVLEDAPECPLVRRLRRLALRDEIGDRRLDLRLGAWLERELYLRDDLSRPQVRVPIREPKVRGRQPARSVSGRNESARGDLGPVAAVRPGVHPYASSDGARDGT